jgi:hypothetical protein
MTPQGERTMLVGSVAILVLALLLATGGWYIGYHMAVADFLDGKHGPTACDGKREQGHPWSPIREWER